MEPNIFASALFFINSEFELFSRGRVWDKNNNAPFVETEWGHTRGVDGVRCCAYTRGCDRLFLHWSAFWALCHLGGCRGVPFSVLLWRCCKVCAGRTPQDMEEVVVHERLPNLPTYLT